MLSKSEIRARGLHLGVVSMLVGFKAVRCSHQGNGDRLGRKEVQSTEGPGEGPPGGRRKRGQRKMDFERGGSDELGQICSSIEKRRQ